MKKRLALVLAAALLQISVISGCGAALQREIGAEDLVLTFDCPAAVQVGEAEYSCQVAHDLTQATTVRVTESPSFGELEYCRSGGETRLSHQSLSCALPEGGLPQNCWFALLADILDFAQSYVNLTAKGGNVFEGSVHGYAFQITADGAGALQSVAVEGGMTVTFFQDHS